MKRIPLLALTFLLAVMGCDRLEKLASGTAEPRAPEKGATLAEARKGFQTKLPPHEVEKEPVAQPPAKIFRKVKYDAPVGKLAAYLTPDPGDGKKHPAIIWITGGNCNTIGDVWTKAPANNDQTARAYREAGIVMMFPSLRGGNDNPGSREGYFGEVDDVLAAADYLSKLAYVDPTRIYLGGHSTGGTMVLLVAECSDRFRAVFSFGPADDVSAYPPEYKPFDFSNPKEVELRSPGKWLAGIKVPVFVIEGTRQGNVESLRSMAQTSTNPNTQFFPVEGATHFTVLAPVNKVLAQKVLQDDGAKCNLTVTKEELSKLFKK